jgi:EpsG family
MAAEVSSGVASAPRPASLLAAGFAFVAMALLAQTLLAWVALAALVTLAATQGRLAWWPAVTVVLLLAVVNSLKWPESDLAEYFTVIDDVRLVSLAALLGDDSALLSIRPTEPAFRMLIWLAAHAEPLPRIAFALFTSLATYGSILWLCHMASSSQRSTDTDWRPAVASAVALLLGVTFSLTGHLVRQYVAGGLFFIGVFGWSFTGRWRWLVWPCLAVAVHNSAAMLGLPLLLAMLLSTRPRLFVLLLGGVVLAAATNRIPMISDLAEATSFLKDDGQIGLALPTLDALLLALTWGVWRTLSDSQRPSRHVAARLLCFAIALAVLLFCIRDVPLLFFRSYFYLEFLRAPMLAFVISVALRRSGAAGLPLAIVAMLLAALVCWLRVRGADWSYGATHVHWPEWLDVHSVVRRWQMIQKTPM